MTARIVAVCNQKGGVGKTTLVSGLAEVFSQVLNKRVLVIDADPQANTSSALGIDQPELTLNDVMYGDPDDNRIIHPGVAADAIMEAGEAWQPRAERNEDYQPVHAIAAEDNLAGREQDTMMARERRLKTSLRGVAEQYDMVLIDCPPSLGLLTINALAAATHALLVTEPRISSVDGLKKISKTIGDIQREEINTDLGVAGVVINRVRKGRSDQAHWISQVQDLFGELVLEPVLPDREIFAQAQAAQTPLRAFGSAAKPLRADLEELARKIWTETKR